MPVAMGDLRQRIHALKIRLPLELPLTGNHHHQLAGQSRLRCHGTKQKQHHHPPRNPASFHKHSLNAPPLTFHP
jgi:hypothetical protein